MILAGFAKKFRKMCLLRLGAVEARWLGEKGAAPRSERIMVRGLVAMLLLLCIFINFNGWSTSL